LLAVLSGFGDRLLHRGVDAIHQVDVIGLGPQQRLEAVIAGEFPLALAEFVLVIDLDRLLLGREFLNALRHALVLG